MTAALPVVAGVVSTAIFASSTMPMLGKALRTRDLRSYSLGNLTMASAGNAVHSLYVFALPPGPLWALHTFNMASTLFMLVWYLRFGIAPSQRARSGQPEPGGVDDDGPSVGHTELGEDRRDMVVGGLR